MDTQHNRKAGGRPAHAAKQQEVDALAERFKKAEIAILAEVRGLTVDKVTELRATLRKGKTEFKVVKNTLAKRALVGTKYESLKDSFKGPVAVALSYDDIVFPAKTLDTFEKNEKGLTVIIGSMAGKTLSKAEVTELAALPNLDQSRSMLLGMFMQPASMLARVLDQYRQKLEEGQGGAAKPEGAAPAAG